jgi:hypothetical protein
MANYYKSCQNVTRNSFSGVNSVDNIHRVKVCSNTSDEVPIVHALMKDLGILNNNALFADSTGFFHIRFDWYVKSVFVQ